MMFRVGQEVVCVNDAPHPNNSIGMQGLTKGTHYHIRKVIVDIDLEPAVMLVEIKRPSKINWGGEVPYLASRFRPVTNIDDLIKLTKVKELENV